MSAKKNNSLFSRMLHTPKNIANKFLPSKKPASPLDLDPKDWRRALTEAVNAFKDKDLSMYSAGVAYFATLALFPLIAACVAISTLILSPQDVSSAVKSATNVIPEEMGKLITSQFSSQSDQVSTNILATILAIGLALFGASGAVQNLINALNRAYSVKETRNFVTSKLVSISLTALFIIGLFIVVGLLTIRTDLLSLLRVPEDLATILLFARWPLLIVLVTIGLSILYRYGPNRKKPRWQWLTWGALIATVVWLIITVVFFIYVQNFANFASTYSVFAGIIIAMMWLNYSATAIILGAQINHRLEKKT
jgi:membrane protein